MAIFRSKGRKFGRLTVIDIVSSKPFIYKCLCDCGNIKNVKYLQLFKGEVKSCGCLRKETQNRNGMSKSLEYSSWLNMHIRVEKTKVKDLETYKNVKIYCQWHKSNPEGFFNFLKDMGPRVSKEMTLDRINNKGDYEPNNCRWATKKEQVLNRGVTKWLTINGETKCLRDWIRFLDIDIKTFYSYMNYHEISYEKTIEHYLETI